MHKHSHVLARVLGVFATLILLAGMITAQTSTGTIAGVVSDTSGAVIPNADVVAKSLQTGETHTGKSNAVGAFRLDGVTPGTYAISVKAQSFSETTIENVDVKASLITTSNATLNVGASESITVEATAAQQLQTDSGEISGHISEQEIKNLPVSTLNAYQLVLTEPGVVTPSGREDLTNGVGFSVNGTRPRANNFLIEGQDNNDAGIQGQGIQPQNLEAVSEVSVLTNSYSAEFGHGGGSVSNLILKSGTNAFHGSGWDLLQNSSLNATDKADKVAGNTKPKFRENTFGFTLGGPIVKNKLFFFGSSQWDRTRQTANGSTLRLPTANGVATLQSLGSQNANTYVAAIGSLRGQTQLSCIAIGGGRPCVETGLTARNGISEPNNALQWNTKVDYILSDKDNFSFRVLNDRNDLSPDFFTNGGALPGFDTLQKSNNYNAGITWNHAFSPSLLNEARVSYGRIGVNFDPTAQTAANPLAKLPFINPGNGLAGFGVTTGFPQSRFHNTFQYQDGVTYNHSTHTFKFGVDFARILVRDGIPVNSRGIVSYSRGGLDPVTGSTFTSLANFVDNFLGQTGSVSQVFGADVIRPKYFFQNYYAQDTWKLKSNLTVNYGVRYENAGTPANSLPFPAIDHRVLGTGTAFPVRVTQKDDANNIAPRVGIAYTPRFWQSIFGNDKTVFRAGYGIFYDNLFTNIIDNIASGSPNAVSGLITGTPGRGQANANTLIGQVSPVLNPKASISTIVDNLQAPVTHQWNVNIERELPGNFVLTTAYVGTRGIRLLANDQLNPGVGDFVHRVNPFFGSIQVRDNSGDSIYHALDVKLDRQFRHGLSLKAAYTYSKLIDDASEVFVTTGASSFPADLTLGHRGIDRGLSAFDRRHRFVVSYIYDVPSFKNLNNPFLAGANQVIANWQLSGTTSYQAGAPETVVDGFDNNGDLQASDRPNLSNRTAPLNTFAFDNGDGTFSDGFSGAIVDPKTVHWVIPFSGLGNVGRNTIIAPGRQDWNFALTRTFKMPFEGHSIQFRTELYNPFNHANTGNATFNLQSAQTDIGNYAETVSGSRTIRFKLKYSF